MIPHYYVLLNNHTKQIAFLKLPKKHYLFLITEEQIFLKPKNDFNLKEKLYILNHSTDVLWKRISLYKTLFFKLFYNSITPDKLKIIPLNGKINILISGKIIRK